MYKQHMVGLSLVHSLCGDAQRRLHVAFKGHKARAVSSAAQHCPVLNALSFELKAHVYITADT